MMALEYGCGLPIALCTANALMYEIALMEVTLAES